MTITELQAKRERILKSLGIARTQFGDRSIQYADQEKALSIIDREIQIASAPTTRRFSLAGFTKQSS